MDPKYILYIHILYVFNIGFIIIVGIPEMCITNRKEVGFVYID